MFSHQTAAGTVVVMTTVMIVGPAQEKWRYQYCTRRRTWEMVREEGREGGGVEVDEGCGVGRRRGGREGG